MTKTQLLTDLLKVGESNAVFLRGVGGDAATDPHKSGCSGYPEEEFSGMHNLAVAEATEFSVTRR